MTSAHHVVVMGVSGCGKTTVGGALAAHLGWAFAEADAFHPEANIAKMSAGTPLTDEDRWPWLRDLGAWMATQGADGVSTVITCSALKRVYRDLLRETVPGLIFVHLDGDPTVIAERMGARSGHFMPPSLLGSQIATLEPLAADEAGVLLDLTRPPEQLVREALAAVAPAAA